MKRIAKLGARSGKKARPGKKPRDIGGGDGGGGGGGDGGGGGGGDGGGGGGGDDGGGGGGDGGGGGVIHFPPSFSVSEIKNRQRRHEAYTKQKVAKRKEWLARKKQRRAERRALGDKAPPKEVPKTLENQRLPDETTVTTGDEEVEADQLSDEFAEYFKRETDARVLITTSDRPRGKTVRLCEDLAASLPSAQVYYRRGLALKKIVPQCVARGFTDLVVINEDRKEPSILTAHTHREWF
uniref:Ribosome production factor 1 n=1 Tax=Petromyzon marinus TaxID=7757 RepID=A0AAJ7SMG7_PETMA|nr:ribosome production factor 1-like [Petromyzon marinus]